MALLLVVMPAGVAGLEGVTNGRLRNRQPTSQLAHAAYVNCRGGRAAPARYSSRSWTIWVVALMRSIRPMGMTSVCIPVSPWRTTATDSGVSTSLPGDRDHRHLVRVDQV